MTSHLDEFVLLRYAVDDLAEDERASVVSHVAGCPSCGKTLLDLEKLDRGLRVLATAGALGDEPGVLAPGDPFRRRPRAKSGHRTAGADPLAAAAIAASERGIVLGEELLDVIRRRPKDRTPELSLADAEHRFALLYALQEAGREIAEDPVGALRFAETVVERLVSEPTAHDDLLPTPAERMVPRVALQAQAHLLTAMACMWTKDFERARSSLAASYRSFGAVGDETGLAHVELVEAQRRAFVHEGAAALVLARRAQATFEERGLEDLAARAISAQGLAYSFLGRGEDSVARFREALPVYERYELWSNYVGCLNGIASSLTSLGRFDEARREYARTLRRFSHERHRHWLGYIRTGLAETLFAAGRFSEAAVSAARAAAVFRDSGMRVIAHTATLLEIESWARHGNLERARHRLDLFQREVSRDQALDPAVAQDIADALSGANPNFERLATLRRHAEDLLQRSPQGTRG